MKSLSTENCVSHQHGDSHRPYPSWYWGDPTCHLVGREGGREGGRGEGEGRGRESESKGGGREGEREEREGGREGEGRTGERVSVRKREGERKETTVKN